MGVINTGTEAEYQEMLAKIVAYSKKNEDTQAALKDIKFENGVIRYLCFDTVVEVLIKSGDYWIAVGDVDIDAVVTKNGVTTYEYDPEDEWEVEFPDYFENYNYHDDYESWEAYSNEVIYGEENV